MAVTTPVNNAVPFAASGLKNTIPVDPSGVPGAASMTAGFPEATMKPLNDGGVPPAGRDVNGILNQLSTHQVFLNAGMLYKFDSDFATDIGGYSKGAVLLLDDGLSSVQSTANSNTTNPNISMTGWQHYGGQASYRAVIDAIYGIDQVVEYAADVDPNDLYPWQTWVRFAPGRVTVGLSTNPSDPPWTQTVGTESGEYEHEPTENEMFPHGHAPNAIYNKFTAKAQDAYDAGSYTPIVVGEGGLTVGSADNNYLDKETQVSSFGPTQWADMTELEVGGGDPFNVVQPSIVTAKWRRTV